MELFVRFRTAGTSNGGAINGQAEAKAEKSGHPNAVSPFLLAECLVRFERNKLVTGCSADLQAQGMCSTSGINLRH